MEIKMLKQMAKLGGILCVITLVTTLALSAVNLLTRDSIEKNAEKSQDEARSALIGAESFERVTEDIYKGTTGGETSGYCVSVTANGYGGPIEMIVGVDTDGRVTGIKILSDSETPGLGSRAKEPAFSDSFKGKKPPLSVVKGGGKANATSGATAAGGQINAISGATVTSNAVVRGVNGAVERLKGEGLIK